MSTPIRPRRIDAVPGLKEQVAEAYANGATQQEIADLAGVNDRGTVAAWLKSPDVQTLVSKYIEERANRILRHTDTQIVSRLEAGQDANGKKLTLAHLLRIRREYAGQQIKLDVGGNKPEAMQELLQRLHENPELAALLQIQLDSADAG